MLVYFKIVTPVFQAKTKKKDKQKEKEKSKSKIKGKDKDKGKVKKEEVRITCIEFVWQEELMAKGQLGKGTLIYAHQ